MTTAVGAVLARGQQPTVQAVERIHGQARRLQEFVQVGGAPPAPDPGVLASLAAGPIPVDQVQQVQALLAEAHRLAGQARDPRPVPLEERAEEYSRTAAEQPQ